MKAGSLVCFIKDETGTKIYSKFNFLFLSNCIGSKGLTLVLLFSAVFGATLKAQQIPQNLSTLNSSVKTQTTVVKTYQLKSQLMGRQMPYNVLFPIEYESKAEKRFPVIYLLHGLGGNYKDWTTRTNLTKYAAQHEIIIVNPEGGNGWYTNSASVPNDKYESYIIEELIPEINKKFRTISERRGQAIAGLSMGGYGAIKFGVKYPEKFVLAASLSGAVAALSWRLIAKVPPIQQISQMLIAIFGAAAARPTHQDNDLYKIFANLPANKILSLPFFYLDCGTEDEFGLLPSNQQLAAILLQRKISHEFRQLPGGHNWKLWDQQVTDVLRLSARIFNNQNRAKAQSVQ